MSSFVLFIDAIAVVFAAVADVCAVSQVSILAILTSWATIALALAVADASTAEICELWLVSVALT